MQTSVCQMRFWDQIQAVRPDLSELFKVLANSLEDKKAWEFVWPDDYALSDNGQNLIQMGIHNYLLRNHYPINRATTTSNAYGLNLALECGIPYLTFVRYVDEIYQMLFWCMAKKPECAMLQIKVGVFGHWQLMPPGAKGTGTQIENQGLVDFLAPKLKALKDDEEFEVDADAAKRSMLATVAFTEGLLPHKFSAPPTT